MVTEKRDSETRLAQLRERLVVTPPRTNFFTAVMLLERLTRDHGRIGGSTSRANEMISFRHNVSFGFQPNDISGIEWVQVASDTDHPLSDSKGRFELTTCVLGLSGADSPLPLYHVEDLVLDSDQSRLQSAFLDIFHNRLTALLYRARSKYFAAKEYQRSARDPLSQRLLAAVGVDRGGDHEPTTPTRTELLGLAALLAVGASTGRSIENSLRALLARDLGTIPLTFQQFQGAWIEFDPDQRTSLGRKNSAMAISWILGTRVQHPAHRARVLVGPMPPTQARDFSPGGPAFERIGKLVHALCTEPIAVDLQLLIDQDAYPPFFIRAKNPRRLGDNVFLSSRRRAGRIEERTYSLIEQS